MSVYQTKPWAKAEERIQWVNPHLLLLGLPVPIVLGRLGLPALDPSPQSIARVFAAALLVHALFYIWRGCFYQHRLHDLILGLCLAAVCVLCYSLPALQPIF